MITNKFSLTFYDKLIQNSLFIREKLIPKKFKNFEEASKYLSFPEISKNIVDCGKISLEDINKSICNPIWSMLNRKGKLWRPKIGLISSNIFINDLENIKKHKNLYKILYLGELIHNSSLIIDDIEDKSLTRRGEKCVHLKYGENIAINAGISLMIFPMNKFLNELKNKYELKGKLSEIFFNEIVSLNIGQGWDMISNCNNIIPIQSYINTVLCKTGVCPRFIIKMVKIYIEDFLGIKTGKIFNDILDLCDDLSIGFQIWDDLMNLIPSTISKNKSKIGEDISEGKLTIMVLHSLLGDFDNKERLKTILLSKTKDQNIINEAIDILKRNGSLKFSVEQKDIYLNRFENKCNKLIKEYEKDKNININVINSLIKLKYSLIKII